MPAGVNAQAAGIPMSDAMGTCKVNAGRLGFDPNITFFSDIAVEEIPPFVCTN